MTVGYGPDGKQDRKYFYGKTRAEAQTKLTNALVEAGRGIAPSNNDRQTVGQFLARWLKDCVKPSVRPSTYARSEQAVRLHLEPKLGRIRLLDLSPAHVQKLMNEKLDEGLSARSVQILHAVLRAALNRAVLWGEVHRNVARLVPPPRSESKPVEPLGPDEARKFLEAVEGHRLQALFVLAISTGLRQGEILGLRWQDVDLEEGVLSVRYTLGRHDGQYCLVEPKTPQSRRTIALPEIALEALKAHRTRQLLEREEVGPGWTEFNLVFTTEHGQPLNSRVPYAAFKRILKAAGLRTQRFHDLRHCTATLLLSQGVHPRLVQEALGHSDVGITLNLYSHVLSELKRQTAVQMDAVLSVK
jgi:integrase